MLASGLLLSDVDARTGGLETLRKWEAEHGVIETLRATTSDGGCHLYFEAPADAELLHSGTFKVDGVSQGIDFKVDGYAVAPPSIHKSGERYTWVNYGVSPAPVPNWLRAFIPVGSPDSSAPFAPVEHAILDLACEMINKAVPGTGHETVNRWSFIVGQYVGRGEIARSTAEPLLTAAFAGRNEQESLKRVLRIGLEKGIAEPNFPKNDMGNAQRLAATFSGNIRHCTGFGWLIWTADGRWERDNSGEIMVCAKKTVANINVEASQIKNAVAQKALKNHALSSGQASKLKAMVELAQSELDIPITIDELDADPWLLGVANGTVDLRSGVLHDAEPWELITKKTACVYAPEGLCPKWERFFDWALAGDEALKHFVHKAIGYSLTGETKENCYFFCHGAGQNGKSTMLGTLDDLFGDYSMVTDFTSFTVKQNDGPRNDIAKMKGSRLVTASEIERGKHLNEALIKQICGGDIITARFLFKDFFDFKPTFKIWFAANDKPEIKGTGDSIWVRTLLIPFNQTVAPGDRNLKLREELRDEGPGILAWAVRGSLLWQKEGLNPPAAVLAATQEYRAEMDQVGRFLGDEEYCALDPKANVGVAEAWKHFQRWCENENERAGRRKEFIQAVINHGHDKFGNKVGIRLGGLRLRSVPDPDPRGGY